MIKIKDPFVITSTVSNFCDGKVSTQRGTFQDKPSLEVKVSEIAINDISMKEFKEIQNASRDGKQVLFQFDNHTIECFSDEHGKFEDTFDGEWESNVEVLSYTIDPDDPTMLFECILSVEFYPEN